VARLGSFFGDPVPRFVCDDLVHVGVDTTQIDEGHCTGLSDNEIGQEVGAASLTCGVEAGADSVNEDGDAHDSGEEMRRDRRTDRKGRGCHLIRHQSSPDTDAFGSTVVS